MKLTHITFQGGGRDGHSTFSGYYREHFTIGGGQEFRQYGLKMLKLIEHLEQNVDAPPQWVCTSHATLSLCPRDFATFAECCDAGNAKTLGLDIHHATGAYEISTWSPEPQVRAWLVRTASDVEAAGQIIAQSLSRASQE